jgi:hypothetical protein
MPDAVVDASAGITFTYEMVPTKLSLEVSIHPPSVTGPFVGDRLLDAIVVFVTVCVVFAVTFVTSSVSDADVLVSVST